MTDAELYEWVGKLAESISELRLCVDTLMEDSEGRGGTGLRLKDVPTTIEEFRLQKLLESKRQFPKLLRRPRKDRKR